AWAGGAFRGAGVINVATSAKRPVLEHGWLAPGAHVNAVGASSPTSWEIEPATVAAAALFCDSRQSVLNQAGGRRRAVLRPPPVGAQRGGRVQARRRGGPDRGRGPHPGRARRGRFRSP